ncbi:hypothetical protein CPC16_011078 [Podila verticillata]|nr:hypothetical protein CPC16_011078 [Podila verticillata]
MFGRQTSSKPSTSASKPSSTTTTTLTNARSTTVSTTSSSGRAPVVAKPGVASKRNSLDLKALSSTASKPLPPIKITSLSAVNTPTVRSPITAKPPAGVPTQPSIPTSGTRSRNSIGSRDQLFKVSAPLKRTTTTLSKPTTARSAATTPSTPTRDTVKVPVRSGSISGQSSRTATPLTSRSATPTTTTASSTKPASTNGAKDPSKRVSVGATPSRVGPPAKAQTSTAIRSTTAPSSKTQSPASSSPPTPRVTSRPSSVHLTGKDLPLSLRKTKTHTPTASLTSPIPSSSPRSSFSSSSSSKPVAKGIVAKSQVSSVSPVVPVPPAMRHAQEEETLNELKEALVEKEATPQISPFQETDDNDTPQLTTLSPPLDEEENNNNNNKSDSVGKTQNDDDGELEDKEKQHQHHQHHVASTPPRSRTQESPPSPSTPTPTSTLQLFKEDGLEAVQSIEQQQQQQEEEPQEPQPLHQAIQVHQTMINNSELSKEGAIKTMYALEPAPFESIDFLKEFEVVAATKEDLPDLGNEVEAFVETTSIALVESKETCVSFTVAMEDLEQNQEQDEKEQGEEKTVIVETVQEPLAFEEEIAKAVEEVVLVNEKPLDVEEEQEEEVGKEQEEEAMILEEGEEEEEEEGVLVVETKEDTQEQEDVDVTVHDAQDVIEVEAVSASTDVSVLDDNEAVESVEEPLPATETQYGDKKQELEAEVIELIAEASIESTETDEESELEVDEVPIEQEAPTPEVMETAEPEEVSLDSIASDAIESEVASIADEDAKDVFPIEEEATFDDLEAASAVENVELAMEDTLTDSTPLVESAMTIEADQDASIEDSATVQEGVQHIGIVAQEDVAVIEIQFDPTDETQALEIIKAVAVGENEGKETKIVSIDENVAIDAIDEEVVIDAINEDAEDTEAVQPELESLDEQVNEQVNEQVTEGVAEEVAEEESDSEAAETIVEDQIETQELVKDTVSTEVDEMQENIEPKQSSKKIEIDEIVLGFEESVENLEISVTESSLDGEAEVEKIIEVDEIPSESTILETEASLEVSETDATEEEILPVVYQVDPTCVSHKFVWNHGGQSVKVTGTFDNWQASVDLQRNVDTFEATVGLDRTKVIHFKFVVDGQWLCASDLETEFDHSGNQNHVLYALV